jgi:hypothetical protein
LVKEDEEGFIRRNTSLLFSGVYLTRGNSPKRIAATNMHVVMAATRALCWTGVIVISFSSFFIFY